MNLSKYDSLNSNFHQIYSNKNSNNSQNSYNKSLNNHSFKS
jgi:hypothetical protein